VGHFFPVISLFLSLLSRDRSKEAEKMEREGKGICALLLYSKRCDTHGAGEYTDVLGGI